MMTVAAQESNSTLIRRANQLYHELTRDSFERIHRHRFRIQRPFWETVVHLALNDSGGTTRSDPAGCSPRTVLDVACGTGFLTRTLASRLSPQDRLIAIDLGEGQLRTAGTNWRSFRAHRPDAPAFLRLATDAQALPLPTASVDLVAMNAALHHMPNPLKVLAEIDRTLRPGGYFAMGFEPNRAYFAAPILTYLGAALARLHWYASPHQNWRRLRTRLGFPIRRSGQPGDEVHVLEAMNHTLVSEGLIVQPLSGGQLLDLIDPHSRGEDEITGFDPGGLLAQSLPGYQIRLLITTDYLGETARFWPTARTVVDAVLRTIIPGHGSLFSWLLRKPEAQR